MRPLGNERETLSLIAREVAFSASLCRLQMRLVVFGLYERRCEKLSVFTVISTLFLKTRNFYRGPFLHSSVNKSQHCSFILI